ncbi:MAG TPA: septum formation family protein [Mycobacterium sp.]|nr:septum formation family protein [Mycobacterium sp.]
MDAMLQAADQDDSPPQRVSWLRAASTRRALLLTALGGLLIAGLVTAMPADGRLAGLLGRPGAEPAPLAVWKSSAAVDRAISGDCLMWPENTLDAATVVNCADEHRFEVAESVDMRTFPGVEYGPDAAPPSAARIEQITQEQCESAVRRYLGAKFDPHSRFVASMLWSGDRAWRQYGERRMLCGLQLPGTDGQQLPFTGKVAEIDQSKVWPAGTCLGIDATTNQPTDVPVDCAAPHTKEVTGTVNLAERFPEALPPEPEQDVFIKDACTRMTDAYLAPVQLRDTTLTLTYATISLPSWSAGSREVACSVGATLGNGGWAALLNSARGPLLINGQQPIPPPEIPAERLNLPTAPQPASSAGTGGPPAPPEGNQHMPQQPAAPPPQPPPVPAAPPAPAFPPQAQPAAPALPPQAQPPPPPDG